jgi:hypothetical protein
MCRVAANSGGAMSTNFAPEPFVPDSTFDFSLIDVGSINAILLWI